MGKRIKILFLLILISGGKLVAQTIEQPIIKVLTGSKGQIKKDSSVLVEDDKWWIPSEKSKLDLTGAYRIKNILTLKLNEDTAVVLKPKFTVTVRFKLILTASNGSVDSSQTPFLSITYDSLSGATYNSQSVFSFYNTYRVKIRILGVDSVYTPSNVNPKPAVTPFLRLENEMQISREYNYTCTAASNLNMGVDISDIQNTGEVATSWPPVQGATEYDLEWAFIDNEALLDPDLYRTAGNYDPVKIFTDNASRITTTSTSYNIPMLYEDQGTLFVRFRPVQNKPNGQRYEGNWSSDNSSGLGQFVNFSGHEPLLNWQRTTSFAEDGKRKSVVEYYDGSLRSRQTVTKDNSTNTTIVAETFYDFQGRPVIQVLPAPTLSSLIRYSKNFNRGINGAYEKNLYDSLINPSDFCLSSAPPMKTDSGAAKYYSVNNPEATLGFNKFIPDAQGYAFTETRYVQDNTGRVQSRSGLGNVHLTGSGHETKYYYGNPDQKELDGLFGTEAGYASHYYKNMIRDANGQYSVSYIDMHGRTIATALAGKAPAGMDTVTSYKKRTITEKISDSTNNIIRDLVLESSRSILVADSGAYIFNYSLNPDSIRIQTCATTNICYDCLYNLEITITDDCNNCHLPNQQPYVVVDSNFTYATIDTLCNTISGFNKSFTIGLAEGNYTITKKLSISKYGMDYYRDSIFMKKNLCKTFNDFYNQVSDSIRSQLDCSQATCETCTAQTSSLDNFRPYYLNTLGIPLSDSAQYRGDIAQAYALAVEECNAVCNNTGQHTFIRNVMLLDMTVPVGQYANPDSANTATSYGNIFNLANPLWRNVIYHDEYGNPDSIINSSGQLVPPNDISVTQSDFINNFKESWSRDLLPLHPEYAKLLEYEKHTPSHIWDERFGSTDTYSDAQSKGYLNPAGMTAPMVPLHFTTISANQDPLTKQDSLLNNVMQNMVYYYQSDPNVGDYISMWGIASVMGKCADNSSCSVNYFNSLLNNCFNPATFCTGELDMAWRGFRQIYLTKKRQLLMNKLHLQFPSVRLLVPPYRNEHFAESSAASDQYLASISGQNSAGVSSNVNTQMQQMYQSNCEDYVSSWWTSLAPCNLTSADSIRLMPRMVGICVAGSDAFHPNGASSTAPGSTLQYKSFEDLVKHYIDSMHQVNPTQYNYDVSCNGYSIYYPQPYNQISPLSNIMLWTKPDSCQCSTLNTLYNQYSQNGNTDASFAAFVLRTTGTVMTDADLAKLRALCSGADTCKFLVTPISLPPALQCGVRDICVTCTQVKNAYDSFKLKFPAVLPAYNNDDSVQALKNKAFSNYMNFVLGFNKQTTDYLSFMDSCSIQYQTAGQPCDSSQATLNNCVSCTAMATVYGQFLSDYPNVQRLANNLAAKVTYDSLFAAYCHNKLGYGHDVNKYYTLLQSCAIPYYSASTTAPLLQGPLLNNPATGMGSTSSIICDTLAAILTDFTAAYPGLSTWNMITIKRQKTFMPYLSYLLSGGGIVHPYPPARIVNPQRWVGSGIRDSGYSSKWFRNNLTFVKFDFTAIKEKTTIDSSILRLSPVLSEPFEADINWSNMDTPWDTTLTYSQLTTAYSGYRVNSYTPMYQYVSGLNNPVYAYNVKTQLSLVIKFPWLNYGQVLASFMNPVTTQSNSETFIGNTDPLTQTDPETMPRIQIQYRLDTIYSCRDLFAAYASARLNIPVQGYDSIAGLYLQKCGSPIGLSCPAVATGPLLCGKNEALFPPITIAEDDPCADSSSLTFVKATELYTAYTDSIRNSFDSVYLAKCKKAFKSEIFTVTHPQSEYHYTLYYYDQAGNLVKTIPPEGVDLSSYSRNTWLDSVAAARKNNTVLIPAHGLQTNYRYNTLNQLVASNTPDAGLTSLWYDRLARLVNTQNAKQKAASATETGRQYSYTRYDALGRIIEVGQLSNATSTALTQSISGDTTQYKNWFFGAALYSLITKAFINTEQVTRTFYDNKYASAIGTPALSAKNLRNRVAYTTYTDGNSPANYNSATFFSYDIHGNVDTLMQDYGQSITGIANVMNSNASRWKRIVYRYDLISGKVNHVAYQPQYINAGSLVILQDAFYHRYSYDAENRLTTMETSADSTVWEKDARYNYYKHGPLARSVIGQLQVQGLDYAYTIQGWQKGMNASSLNHGLDMGNDGDPTNNSTKYIGRDVYGYSLNYFNGDYTTIGGTNPFAPVNGSTIPGADYRPLYNGNISSMAVNIRKFNSVSGAAGDSAMLYNYKYDQLNRLKEMDAFRGLNTSTNSWSSAAKITNYKERITYDGNGNILRYLRNGNIAASIVMDSLSYQYTYNSGRLQNNKLNWVKDNVTASTYSADIDNQAAANYTYDAIGNLLSDSSENIRISAGGIKWNVYGKITEINKIDSSAATPNNRGRIKKITYSYDPAGNRISKRVVKYTTKIVDYTWYVRDAAGNVMSVYTYSGDSSVANPLSVQNLLQTDIYLYGSSRVGAVTVNRNTELTKQTWDTSYTLALGLGTAIKSPFTRGLKQYELSNHLGNILVTISDKKKGVSANGTTVDYYNGDVVAANDYYPGGMIMPRRSYSAGNTYRYGFNGKEMDNEVKGSGNQYDYGFRIYDPRISRFLSVDPLAPKYPFYTPYQFASNSPIQAVDLDGLEGVQYLETQTDKDGKSVIKRVVEVDVYVAVSRKKESSHFYSKKPENDVKVQTQVIGDLKSQFPDNKFKDDAGIDVIWRFNVQAFEVDANGTVETKFNELKNNPAFKIIPEGGGAHQYRGFILQKQHLSDEVVPSDPTDLPVTEEGNFSRGFLVTVNDQYYSERDQRAHTEGHETTHFFLRLHPKRNIRDPENTPAGHAGAGGGILNYGTAQFRYPGQIRTSPDEKTTVSFDGIKPLNQTNVTNILQSVPQKPEPPKQ